MQFDISYMSHEFSKNRVLNCSHLHQLKIINSSSETDFYLVSTLHQLWSLHLYVFDENMLAFFENCSHLRHLQIGNFQMLKQERDRYILTDSLADQQYRNLTFQRLREQFRELLNPPPVPVVEDQPMHQDENWWHQFVGSDYFEENPPFD